MKHRKRPVASKLIQACTGLIIGMMIATVTPTAKAVSSNSLYQQNFFSLRICGSFANKLDGALSAGLNGKLDGFGSLGIDVYGNSLKGRLTPSASVDAKASMGAGANISLTGCLDLIKLAEFLEKEVFTTEAEQALVDALSVFDPDELRNSLVNVAFLTGLDPNRMISLIEQIPSVADDMANRISTGDPLELLRSVSTLSNLANDLPLPLDARTNLADMESALANHLSASFDILSQFQNICSQPVEPGLQAAIDEICKPLNEIGLAEDLETAILLIPQLLSTTEDVQDTVNDSLTLLEQIEDFIVNTVNVSINALQNTANSILSFLQNVVNVTLNGINTAVAAIKSVVDSIEDIVDGLSI